MDETKYYVKVGTEVSKPFRTREAAEKAIEWHRKVGVAAAYITLIEPTRPVDPPAPAPVAPTAPEPAAAPAIAPLVEPPLPPDVAKTPKPAKAPKEPKP